MVFINDVFVFKRIHKKAQEKEENASFLIHKAFKNALPLCHQSFLKQTLVFICLQYKSFENTVGKRSNCS